MKTYEKPNIIVKSLATDEMLMTNQCGQYIYDICKEDGFTIKSIFNRKGHGLKDGYVRAGDVS